MEHIIQGTKKVQQLLRLTYGFVPIVAGADKFANLLTNWKEYLNTSITHLLPFSTVTFISIIGIIEIAAGILVLWRPRIGAWVVMGWLIVIALSLILEGRYFDVAVRDLVMAVGAFALAKLSGIFSNIKPAYT